MAKIKTLKVSVGGEYYDITIKCGTNGVFTFSAPDELLNIVTDLKSVKACDSLSSLERDIDRVIRDYEESAKSARLVIGIRFGAKGDVCTDSNGNTMPDFEANGLRTGRFYIDSFMCSLGGSTVNLEYRLFVEESIGNSKQYYRAIFADKLDGIHLKTIPKIRFVDGFVGVDRPVHNMKQYNIIIKYSKEVMDSLCSIENQLRKAVVFLSELFSNDDVERVLSSNGTKFLGK